MAAAKTKSKKSAAKAVRTSKTSRTVASGTLKSAMTVKKPVLKQASKAEVHSQTVHLLAFIFTCLCLVFMAVAYYAYS